MEDVRSCERCARELPARMIKEVVYEEGRERVGLLVCAKCLDGIMNDSHRVRGVVGTLKRAAAHIDLGSGVSKRRSLGDRK